MACARLPMPLLRSFRARQKYPRPPFDHRDQPRGCSANSRGRYRRVCAVSWTALTDRRCRPCWLDDQLPCRCATIIKTLEHFKQVYRCSYTQPVSLRQSIVETFKLYSNVAPSRLHNDVMPYLTAFSTNNYSDG
jgi:hypothetical protein